MAKQDEDRCKGRVACRRMISIMRSETHEKPAADRNSCWGVRIILYSA
jgi:hypothetical protein